MKRFILSTLNHLGYDLIRTESPKPVRKQDSVKRIDSRIIESIFNFYDMVPPFYDDAVPAPLRIAGMWKGILEKGRKTQLKYIYKKDKETYYTLQTEMFWNELIDGLWNYNFYKPNSNCSPKFLVECKLFERITGKATEDLATNKVWPCWGLGTGRGIIKYVDPSHGVTAFHILQLMKNSTIQDTPAILDIGSGYGGLAEKIMSWSDNSVNMFLIDIPLNLTTAYAYLAHIFGTERVTLISSKEQLVNLKKQPGKFLLIPTILIPDLPTGFDFDIINNTHSFSEMDLPTVKYYLEHLVTAKTSYLIETNVGVQNHTFVGHLELMSRDFPIPKTHRLLSRFPDGIQSRYVTSIYQSFQGGK